LDRGWGKPGQSVSGELDIHHHNAEGARRALDAALDAMAERLGLTVGDNDSERGSVH
jgi:hypothetical protein